MANQPVPNKNAPQMPSNPVLREAVKAFRADKTQQNLNAVATALVGATLLVPATIKVNKKPTPQELAAILKSSKVQFPLLTTPEKKKYLVGFTDGETWKGVQKMKFAANTLVLMQALQFDRLAAMMGTGSEIDGLILNPDTPETMRFEKAMFLDLAAQKKRRTEAAAQIRLQPGDNITIVEPTVLPDALLDPICKVLAEKESIAAAYLQVMIVNETDKSYLLVLDGARDNALFTACAQAARPYLASSGKKMNMNITTSETPLGQQGMRGSEPFYRKGEGRIYDEDDE